MKSETMVLSSINRFSFAFILAVLALSAEPGLTAPPSAINLTTIDGEKISPLTSGDGKPVVVIFITVDCPVTNSLAPEISRIYEAYRKRGVRFTLVHVDPDLSDADARKHAADYSLKLPIVIDRKHQIIKAAKATITPEAGVFDGKGKLVYIGRINDQWTDYGKRRAAPTEHNLRVTLDALLNGHPVPKASAPAVGCYIPDLVP